MTTTEYYKDFYGCTASIRNSNTGSLLTIRSNNGSIITRKQYKTRNGARIALGKASDCWTFTKLESKGKIRLASL